MANSFGATQRSRHCVTGVVGEIRERGWGGSRGGVVREHYLEHIKVLAGAVRIVLAALIICDSRGALLVREQRLNALRAARLLDLRYRVDDFFVCHLRYAGVNLRVRWAVEGSRGQRASETEVMCDGDGATKTSVSGSFICVQAHVDRRHARDRLRDDRHSSGDAPTKEILWEKFRPSPSPL